MALKKKLLTSGPAALAVLATAGAAWAAPGVATSNVNVRSGPGTGYPVIGTLMRGESVNIDSCRGSWCYIERRGREGWVSSSYLAEGRGGWDRGDRWDDYYRPAPIPPRWDPAPRPDWRPRPVPVPIPAPVYPSRPNASFCFDGPNGYFCAGS